VIQKANARAVREASLTIQVQPYADRRLGRAAID